MRVLKLVCVVLVTVTVMLCGCGKHNNAQSPSSAFKADFTAEYAGMKLRGSLTNTGRGMSTLALSQPDTLSGLRLMLKNGVVSFARDGILATADEAYLPQNSLPQRLREVFKALDEQAFSPTDEARRYSLGETTLITDKNLLPLKIEDRDFTVNFLNAKKID